MFVANDCFSSSDRNYPGLLASQPLALGCANSLRGLRSGFQTTRVLFRTAAAAATEVLIAVAGYIILRDGVQSGGGAGGGAANGHNHSLVPPQNKHVREANFTR